MELSELDLSKSKLKQKITFRNARLEIILPMFTGTLGSLLCCAALVLLTNILPAAAIAEGHRNEGELEGLPVKPTSAFLSVPVPAAPDMILKHFAKPEYSEWVVDFFASITANREIAQAILDFSEEFNVPPALAFALSWEESRFNPRAVNRGNRDGSIDRGLFQLNNRSFPDVDLDTFFDIRANARYGIAHLSWCIATGGNVVTGLAMYNAGIGRISSGAGTPRVTLGYISRILDNQSRIEARFYETLLLEQERRIIQYERERAQNTANQLQFSRTLRTISPPP